MRYGGIKLAKPPNYSAKHPTLATESADLERTFAMQARLYH